MSLTRSVLLGAAVLGGCARANLTSQVRPGSIPAAPVSVTPAPAVIATPKAPDSAFLAAAARAADSVRIADSIRAAEDERARFVADSIAMEALEADSVAPEITETFPMLSLDPYAANDRVEHYLKLFTGTAKSRTGQRLSAGTRYAALIRDKLRAAGIPEEFTYLAMIESGYNPHAYSAAAAVGMWQFMASTARAAGLRVDWWIDERRDVVRATDAAIRFLNELRDQFGSLYLAAAAYNGGPGRVSRGLSRLSDKLDDTEGDDQFFVLASTNLLRAETKNYVPQLIAAAIVGRDPLAYGITVDTQPGFTYDSVFVPAATPLAAVARACDSELASVLDYNGQVLRGMTAPGTKGSWLRVEAGCAGTFADSFAAIPAAERAGVATHVVKKGETPNAIAKKTGVPVATLRRYNPTLKTAAGSAIPAGRKLVIPTKHTQKGARNVPDPSIERWGGAASGGTYVVRRGETLGHIALRNGTSVTALKRLNGLRSDRIVAGQKLRVR